MIDSFYPSITFVLHITLISLCPQNEISECASAPCQHGGSCNELLNGYTCSCPGGYSGLLCQNEINECASSPCQNGGSCTDGINGFTCSCPGGFSGLLCQVYSFFHVPFPLDSKAKVTQTFNTQEKDRCHKIFE